MIEFITVLQLITCFSICNCPLENTSSDSFLSNETTREENKNCYERSGGDYSIDEFTRDNVLQRLGNEYQNFTWSTNGIHKTSDVSGALPINVQGSAFPSSYITWALDELNLPSSYGGCGPIAMIGIMDYFYRTLGYNQIMSNPYDSDYRKAIAYDVLDKMKTYELDNSGDNTLSFPWDMRDGFNALMRQYGLSSEIHASCSNSLPWFQQSKWNTIKENIDNGLPVTIMVGLESTIGRPCDGHCSNIVGYETFYGNSQSGETVIKDYFIVRINFSDYEQLYYCDADVLNQIAVTLITYNISYSNLKTVYASDFAEEFVNSSGGGQYFYYEVGCNVWTSTNYHFTTNRLRCSYIEDEYLVLSPKREGAGTAFLEITAPHKIQKLTFDSALWGNNEGHTGLTFKIQYSKNAIWYDRIEIDMLEISRNKQSPDSFIVLLPESTHTFRFYITHNNPSGTYNRGRTILDNLTFSYN